MASKFQTRTRPLKGPSPATQSNQIKSNKKLVTNDSTSDIQQRYFSFIIRLIFFKRKNNNNTRFNNNYSTNPTSQPNSILKKPRTDKAEGDRFNETIADWQQPSELDFLPAQQMYSPIGTPPRLRA